MQTRDVICWWKTIFALVAPLALTALTGAGGPRCEPIPVEPNALCEPFVTALADCPFDLHAEVPDEACEMSLTCRDAPCATDADCPLTGAYATGQYCVTGNCVFCWDDTPCDEGLRCRGGRCVDLPASPPSCSPTGPCDEPGCHLVNPSEDGCPICACERPVSLPCAEDVDCQFLSSIRAPHCIAGHCAECRTDDECMSNGLRCLPPGLCVPMLEHPSAVYGTWLVGWPGGLDHFSYLRFEPDGTLRRGWYGTEQPAWADDIALPSCGELPRPIDTALVGTWAPEVTESGFLILRLRLAGPCAPDEAWTARYHIQLADDGQTASFRDIIDGEWELRAGRVPPDRCPGDMSPCHPPEWSDVYP